MSGTKQREFTGTWTSDTQHAYCFTLRGRGSYTKLHAHEREHSLRGNKRLGVYIIRPDGTEAVRAVGPFQTRVILAHYEHIVFALDEGETGAECLFARFDASGDMLNDPKEASRKPYCEPCDESLLPEMVKRFLGENP